MLTTSEGKPTTIQDGDCFKWNKTHHLIGFFRPSAGDVLGDHRLFFDSIDDKKICHAKTEEEVERWLEVIAALSGLSSTTRMSGLSDNTEWQFWMFV